MNKNAFHHYSSAFYNLANKQTYNVEEGLFFVKLHQHNITQSEELVLDSQFSIWINSTSGY